MYLPSLWIIRRCSEAWCYVHSTNQYNQRKNIHLPLVLVLLPGIAHLYHSLLQNEHHCIKKTARTYATQTLHLISRQRFNQRVGWKHRRRRLVSTIDRRISQYVSIEIKLRQEFDSMKFDKSKPSYVQPSKERDLFLLFMALSLLEKWISCQAKQQLEHPPKRAYCIESNTIVSFNYSQANLPQ